MDFQITSGIHVGKTHRHWQYVLQEAREHLKIARDGKFTVLAVGFFPGQSDVLVDITFQLREVAEVKPDKVFTDDALVVANPEVYFDDPG